MEDARSVVLRFCDLMSQRETGAMLALVAEDVHWAAVGRPDRFAYGGVHGKAEAEQYMPAFLAAFETFRFDVHDVICEGDRVAIDASSHGVMPTGKIYHNEYLMHFAVKDGQIVSIKEFFDQQELLEFVEA